MPKCNSASIYGNTHSNDKSPPVIKLNKKPLKGEQDVLNESSVNDKNKYFKENINDDRDSLLGNDGDNNTEYDGDNTQAFFENDKDETTDIMFHGNSNHPSQSKSIKRPKEDNLNAYICRFQL